MIFTHIFRYLDDRDAEEMKKNNGENFRPPAEDYRFHVSSTEHRDAKFGQISWKATPGLTVVSGSHQTGARVSKTSSSAPLAQGFCSLRGETLGSTSTKKQVLPPIRKLQSSELGGKEYTQNENYFAKLPPIEPLDEKTQAFPKKSRGCSGKGKESIWNNTSVNTRPPQKDQMCLGTNRAEPLNTVGQVKEENNPRIENVTTNLTPESSADNWNEKHRLTMQTVDDMSLTTAGTKTSYYRTAKMKLDSETFKVRSSKTDEIKADEKSEYKIRRIQTRLKSFSDGEESPGIERHQTWGENVKTKTTGNLYRNLGLIDPKAGFLRHFAKQKIGPVKSRCYSTPCVQAEEVVRFKTRGGSTTSVVRGEGKTKHQVQLVACVKGRRNAICEVIERSIVPEFGSSLYEMRKSLISIR